MKRLPSTPIANSRETGFPPRLPARLERDGWWLAGQTAKILKFDGGRK